MRLDNAVVVDFLTSTAGALREYGLLEGKEADNLRLLISSHTAQNQTLDVPILIALHQQKSEFLSVLDARYGTVGYCLNLLRYSMRPLLAETIRLLAEFGTKIVRRAELRFNRPFLIGHQGVWERHAPYSSVLIDFSEALETVTDQVAEALQELQSMNGHSMAGDYDRDAQADEMVAEALGFSEVRKTTRQGRPEITAKRKIALALEELAIEVSVLIQQLAANAGSQESYAVAVGCDSLRAECVRLSHLELPIPGNIIAWEIRRRAILSALASVNEALNAVTSNALALIAQDSRSTDIILPESARRRLTYDMIMNGITPSKAWEASNALFSYLTEHRLLPSQVLVGELNRIHPTLTAKSLETIVTLEKEQSLMAQALHEKSSTLARAHKLTEAFARLSMFMMLFLLGCGLKTRPNSEQPEVRPDIPFRMSQQSAISTKDSSHDR